MSENSTAKNSLDLAAVRAKLAHEGGKRFWQSIEELSDTKEFRNFLENEFPAGPEKASDGINRRDVLKLMAASAALTGLGACTKLPTEKIVPYVRQPEEIIPGRPLFYATSLPQAGVGTGVLVESNMGRPTKIEGNPEHPGSLGGADVFLQGSVLNLYDPDRSQAVIFDGRVSTWTGFAAAMANERIELAPRGAGMRILTKTVTSPTLAAQLRKLLAQFPEAKWHQYEVCGGDSEREGMRLAFGKPVNAVYHFDRADVIVSLDADFIASGRGHVRYIREFSSRRNLAAGPASNLNRLYVVESTTTSTGAMADHRLPLSAAGVEDFSRQLANAVGVKVAPGGGVELPGDWVGAVARDLAQHRGSSLILAGEQQPPFVHALAHAMNAALGNVGKTVEYTEPIEANPVNQIESLRELVGDLNSRQVEFLLILGGNPVYDAPADFNFADALMKATLRVHTGLYNDETGELCHWHVPAAHYLESWSDLRAYDGTVGVVQPLIAPLYDNHSSHEIIALLTGDGGASGHDLVRDYWQSQRPEKDKAFEAFWETSLHDGVMAGSALAAISVALRADFASEFASQAPLRAQSGGASGLEVVFRPDPAIGDGEFANNGWLQELPKPITHITWDNAALVSPATAQRLGLAKGDYVKLAFGGREAKAGVFLVPGQADNSVTLHLGYGRSRAGKVGTGPGFNAYLLRTSGAPSIGQGLTIEKTGDTYEFACTQQQNTIDVEGHPADEETASAERRDLVQIATLEEFRNNPAFAKNPENQIEQGFHALSQLQVRGLRLGDVH